MVCALSTTRKECVTCFVFLPPRSGCRETCGLENRKTENVFVVTPRVINAAGSVALVLVIIVLAAKNDKQFYPPRIMPDDMKMSNQQRVVFNHLGGVTSCMIVPTLCRQLGVEKFARPCMNCFYRCCQHDERTWTCPVNNGCLTKNTRHFLENTLLFEREEGKKIRAKVFFPATKRERNG